jgi:hypothetical protein
MNHRTIILYRETPHLSVARFRLHQARRPDKTFVAVRFSDHHTRPKPRVTFMQRLRRWLLS